MLDNVDFKKETDKFIDLFKELEQVIKTECEKNGIRTENENIGNLINLLSKKNSLIRNYKRDLDLIRDVRNINSHKKDDNYKYVVCPSPDINIRLENIINEIKKPPLISESKIMIKWNDIYKREITDNIFETIKTMSEKVYTFVPILEDKKFIGVFSENVLLDVIKRDEGIILDENTDFSKFKEILKVQNHSMEQFKFISRNTNIYDAQNLFNNYFTNDKVLGCIFVTEHGNESESVLGMFTAWDVLGN